MPDPTDSRSTTSDAQAAKAPSPDERGSAGCVACGAPLPPEALFCGECGAPSAPSCPRCNLSVTEQDFCQGCGQWLRPGDCRFCYGPVPEGAAFCPCCGGDQAGIACSGCGVRNFFDFCSNCCIALTDAAQESGREIATDPVITEALEKLQQGAASAAPSAPDENTSPPAAEDGPAPPQQAAPSSRRGLFSAEQRQVLLDMSTDVDRRDRELRLQLAREAEQSREIAAAARRLQDQAAQRQAALRTQKADEARLARDARKLVEQSIVTDLLKQLQGRTFATQQEARRFFMALQAAFSNVNIGLSLKGWRCNRYGVVHQQPNQCAAPHFGGVWLVG